MEAESIYIPIIFVRETPSAILSESLTSLIFKNFCPERLTTQAPKALPRNLIANMAGGVSVRDVDVSVSCSLST